MVGIRPAPHLTDVGGHRAKGRRPPDRSLLRTAADYLLYVYHNERATLTQAVAVHQALRAAGKQEAARRFALGSWGGLAG